MDHVCILVDGRKIFYPFCYVLRWVTEMSSNSVSVSTVIGMWCLSKFQPAHLPKTICFFLPASSVLQTDRYKLCRVSPRISKSQLLKEVENGERIRERRTNPSCWNVFLRTWTGPDDRQFVPIEAKSIQPQRWQLHWVDREWCSKSNNECTPVQAYGTTYW